MKNLTQKITLLGSLLFSALAFSAEHGAEAGAHHAATGVPTEVYWQALNFLIYVAVLVVLLRKPVREFFLNRANGYKQALAKAETARAEAEAKQRAIQKQLNDLESSTQKVIAQAKVDAEALRTKLIAEAQELSENLRKEAAITAKSEVSRAQNKLRAELLEQAMVAAQKALKEKTVDQEQKRLQSEFVEKIQLVR